MNWEQGHYGVNHVSVKYKILFFKTGIFGSGVFEAIYRGKRNCEGNAP